VRLITVGALDQMYKGVDVLIQAVALCRRAGCDVRLAVVGDGQQLASLKTLARELGVFSEVEFLGMLPAGEAVRKQLDSADLFVLASRQEGLPRSMIEAMARGLPCVGTHVGGIPELLPDEDCVPPNDAVALAATIRAVASHIDRMNSMASRNLCQANQYEETTLRARRNQLYTAVHAATSRWLAGGRATPDETLLGESGQQRAENLPVLPEGSR
jgi:glycosyltransferase involved in cell wall biosynthesis